MPKDSVNFAIKYVTKEEPDTPKIRVFTGNLRDSTSENSLTDAYFPFTIVDIDISIAISYWALQAISSSWTLWNDSLKMCLEHSYVDKRNVIGILGSYTDWSSETRMSDNCVFTGFTEESMKADMAENLRYKNSVDLDYDELMEIITSTPLDELETVINQFSSVYMSVRTEPSWLRILPLTDADKAAAFDLINGRLLMPDYDYPEIVDGFDHLRNFLPASHAVADSDGYMKAKDGGSYIELVSKCGYVDDYTIDTHEEYVDNYQYGGGVGCVFEPTVAPIIDGSEKWLVMRVLMEYNGIKEIVDFAESLHTLSAEIIMNRAIDRLNVYETTLEQAIALLILTSTFSLENGYTGNLMGTTTGIVRETSIYAGEHKGGLRFVPHSSFGVEKVSIVPASSFVPSSFSSDAPNSAYLLQGYENTKITARSLKLTLLPITDVELESNVIDYVAAQFGKPLELYSSADLRAGFRE